MANAGSQAGTTAANLGTLGLFSSIAGVFGSTQEKRAAAEARNIINRARTEGIARSQAYETEFSPFVTSAKGFLDQAGQAVEGTAGYEGLLQKLLADTQEIEVGEGLSSSDKIAYEDAARLLNEQMVSTGNLRSGAAAFGQSQLLRRVVADANERNFSRKVAKLQLLFGGQQQGVAQGLARAQTFQGIGATSGQIGLYGKQLSSQLLQAAMGLAPAAAGAELKKGAALSQQIGFGGSIADTIYQGAVASGVGSPGQFGHFGEYSKVTNF